MRKFGKCVVCKAKDIHIVIIGFQSFKGGVSLCDACRKAWYAYFASHSTWASSHWKEAFNAWRYESKEVVQFT